MTDKATRERIIEAADQLFYQQGFEQTSFSDIADAVQISRGNFYYHFKSKDDILQAVIAARMARVEQMLTQWEAELAQPYERILRYIDILITNQAHIKKFGCPTGSLCTELAKLRHASQTEANALLVIYRTWLIKQFTLLGHRADATALAMHLIARGQGIATLANVFHDEKFLQQEVQQLREWLKTIAPHK
jgi:AcrR family transcriptional regulator